MTEFDKIYADKLQPERVGASSYLMLGGLCAGAGYLLDSLARAEHAWYHGPAFTVAVGLAVALLANAVFCMFPVKDAYSSWTNSAHGTTVTRCYVRAATTMLLALYLLTWPLRYEAGLLSGLLDVVGALVLLAAAAKPIRVGRSLCHPAASPAV